VTVPRACSMKQGIESLSSATNSRDLRCTVECSMWLRTPSSCFLSDFGCLVLGDKRQGISLSPHALNLQSIKASTSLPHCHYGFGSSPLPSASSFEPLCPTHCLDHTCLYLRNRSPRSSLFPTLPSHFATRQPPLWHLPPSPSSLQPDDLRLRQ